MQIHKVAQAPTPTPGAWATLTPIPTGNATIPAGLDGNEAIVLMSERAVQGYQFFSDSPVFNVLYLALILGLVIVGLRSIIRRVKAL